MRCQKVRTRSTDVKRRTKLGILESSTQSEKANQGEIDGRNRQMRQRTWAKRLDSEKSTSRSELDWSGSPRRLSPTLKQSMRDRGSRVAKRTHGPRAGSFATQPSTVPSARCTSRRPDWLRKQR